MKFFRLFVCIFAVISMSDAHASCTNPRLITPSMADNPGVVPIGSVTFACDEVVDGPDITLDEWCWQFEGQRSTNVPTYTIDASTSGAKIVSFHFELCNAAGCTGGTAFPTALVGAKPSLFLANSGSCIASPLPGSPGHRRAFFNITKSANDPNPNTELKTTLFNTISGQGTFSEVSGQGTFTTNVKGVAIGRGQLSSTVDYVDSNGFPKSFNVLSDPQEITITCPNLPPILSSVGGDETMLLGGTRGFSVVATDPDGDSFSEYRYLVTGKPADSNIPTEVSVVVPPTNQSLLFTPDLPGQYTLSVTVKDNEGAESAPMEKRFTVTGSLVQPKFKVRLASDNKEYLFEDCAPFNDPCKNQANINKYEGGEFLLDDEITLDASDVSNGTGMQYNWAITGPGSANGDPSSCLTLVPTSANTTTCRLPSAGFGDYQIELKLSKNGVFSEPTIKLISVEERIETAFTDLGKTPTADKPFPYFSQLDYSSKFDQWHRNGGKGSLLKDGGCAVASLTMLARIKEPSFDLDPPGFNQYLTEQFNAFDANNNVLWYPAARALGSLNSNPPVLAITSPWSRRPKRDELEHLARKRKMMILWTHSRSHQDTDNPVDFPKATWVTKSGPCSIAAPNIKKCHERHNHYVVVSGLGFLDGKRSILLKDPGYKITLTQSLDHTRQRSEGYDSQYYGVAVYTPEGSSILRPKTLGSIEAVLLDSDEDALLTSPSGQRLGTDPATLAEFQEISGGFFGGSGIARDGDDAGGEALSSGVKFSIPSLEQGIYTIRTKLNAQGLAGGSAVILGSDGAVLRRKFFQVSGTQGALVTLSFSTENQTVTAGQLALSAMRFLGRTESRADEVELQGTIALGSGSNGLNPGSEESGLLVGVNGASIPAGSLKRLGDTWAFYEPAKAGGIYDLRVKDDGSFLIKARNLSAYPFKQGDKTDVAITIGDDEFRLKATIANTIGKQLIRLTPERLSYTVGERARISLEALVSSSNPETETVGVLFKNGDEEFPMTANESEYSILLRTPGVIQLSAQVYLQNKRQAKEFLEGIKAYRAERDTIKDKLEDGVDEDTREMLERRLQEVERRLIALKAELAKVRTPMGQPVWENIYVE